MGVRCRKCGSTNTADELQWDTVIGHECCDCGYYWSIGFVGGFPGEHYFVPYRDEPGMFDDMDDDNEEHDELAEHLGLSVEALEVLTEIQQDDYIEDDDLPF